MILIFNICPLDIPLAIDNQLNRISPKSVFLISTSLFSYPLPTTTTYDQHLLSIRNHLHQTFRDDVLIIDKQLLSTQTAKNGINQESMSTLITQHLPEPMRLFIQQQQHGNMPNFFTPQYHRKIEMWRKTRATATGTGGGVMQHSNLPHHKQQLAQHTPQPNPHNTLTCPVPLSTDVFFLSTTTSDIESAFLTIPFCPDTSILRPAENGFDQSVAKQITQNVQNKSPSLFDNLDESIAPLDEVERWLASVTASLGGEIIRGGKTMRDIFCTSHEKLIQTFSVHKDMVIHVPGNNVVMSVGRLCATTTSGLSAHPTTTMIVEIEILGYNAIALDPLVFHSLFTTLHPQSEKYLWKYANSSFSPSISYTLHDLCHNFERLNQLKSIYTTIIHPSDDNRNQIFPQLTNYMHPPASTAILHKTKESKFSIQNEMDEMSISLNKYGEQVLALPNDHHDIIEANYILGICVLPSVETHLFHQYKLNTSFFHTEHLILMYIHLILNPHRLAL